MAVKQTNQAFVLLGYTRSGFERERERDGIRIFAHF